MSNKEGSSISKVIVEGAKTTRPDLAQEIMGNNALQGNDQSSVRNQRQAQADVKQKTDGLIESFERLDKDARAEADLGKGNKGTDQEPVQ